jgi:hypothetical protein
MNYQRIVAGFVCAFLILIALPGNAAPQKPTSLMATAKGKGTIKVGREEFPLHSVILKLKEDGALELTLVSEITLFFEGTWSSGDDIGKGIDLKINPTATGSTQGAGKVFLRDDGKSIARMTLQASNKFRKTNVEVQFLAE